MYTFSGYQTEIPRFINVSDSDTKTWAMNLINNQLRYITTNFYFNERTYAVPGGTQASQQWYRLPPNIGDTVNVTVNINGVLWIPSFAGNRRYWDALNVITFVQDYPLFFYIWNNQLGLFPMPATTGYPITINYKERLVDLTQADYTTGTVSATQYKSGSLAATANSANISATTNAYTPILAINDIVRLTATGSLPTGFSANTNYYVVSVTNTPTLSGQVTTPGASGNSTTYTIQLSATQNGAAITPTTTGKGTITYLVDASIITGSGTAFSQNMVGQWLQITPSATDAANGDNRWYQIQAINSATQLVLFNEYIGTGSTASISGAAFKIGQAPLVNENYQDLPLYYMAMVYYATRLPDKGRYEMYKQMYDEKFAQLNKEFGSKTTSPVLLDADVNIYNPNLFLQNQQQIS